MSAQAKNRASPLSVYTSSIRITPQGREALGRVAKRMGWEVGRTASVAAMLVDQASDEQLLEAMRRLRDAEQ